MITIYRVSCAAAFKNYFRFKISCFNSIGFKELYRQKRDLCNRVNRFRLNMKGICISAVNPVILILEMKKLDSHPVKIVKGCVEDLIFPIRYFSSVIQLIIIKFDI